MMTPKRRRGCLRPCNNSLKCLSWLWSWPWPSTLKSNQSICRLTYIINQSLVKFRPWFVRYRAKRTHAQTHERTDKSENNNNKKPMQIGSIETSSPSSAFYWFQNTWRWMTLDGYFYAKFCFRTCMFRTFAWLSKKLRKNRKTVQIDPHYR